MTCTTGSSTSARVMFYAPTNGGAWGDDFTLTAGTGSRVASEDLTEAGKAGLRVHPNPQAGRRRKRNWPWYLAGRYSPGTSTWPPAPT